MSFSLTVYLLRYQDCLLIFLEFYGRSNNRRFLLIALINENIITLHFGFRNNELDNLILSHQVSIALSRKAFSQPAILFIQ